jgi:hypothetical protein
MRRLSTLLLSLGLLAFGAGVALACHVDGRVVCKENGQPLEGVRIDVTMVDDPTFTFLTRTDAQGNFGFGLPCEPHCYTLTITPGDGETVVTPASGTYEFCTEASNNYIVTRDFVLSSPKCGTTAPGACWLTAGGAKFSAITGESVGDYTKLYNWGGNVYPSCSQFPGDGGSWNNIDNLNRLHFHGTDIEVIQCGNVEDHEAGSESPVTPYNFIEFRGTGWLKGIKGNKADFGTVHFWAHVQDRNEPGSNGQKDGAGKDRYFLNVFTDPADPVGTSVMLIDVDGDPATMDPVTITDGNMQLHDTSCDDAAAAMAPATLEEGTAPAGRVSWLANPYPNPGNGTRTLRYGLATTASVSLRVFDAAGRLVNQLQNGVLPAGDYTTTWDLRDADGSAVPAGVYFVRMTLGRQVFTRTVTVTP